MPVLDTLSTMWVSLALHATYALADRLFYLGNARNYGKAEYTCRLKDMTYACWQVKSLPQGCRLTVSLLINSFHTG